MICWLIRWSGVENADTDEERALKSLGRDFVDAMLTKHGGSLSGEIVKVEIYLQVVQSGETSLGPVPGAVRWPAIAARTTRISMLSLHLIQNCMVYINTLMIQKVLARPRWQQAMTPRDYAALTPLIWIRVNPYGRFDLDMNARMALA